MMKLKKVLVLGEQDFWETFSRSTLKRWTRCNDCERGITEDSFGGTVKRLIVDRKTKTTSKLFRRKKL